MECILGGKKKRNRSKEKFVSLLVGNVIVFVSLVKAAMEKTSKEMKTICTAGNVEINFEQKETKKMLIINKKKNFKQILVHPV